MVDFKKLLIIEKMKHIYPEPITLSSGLKSRIKYEIERLSDDDLDYLASLVPIPNVNADIVISKGGGMHWAEAISRKFNIPFNCGGIYKNLKVIVADDVITTGTTVRELCKNNNVVLVIVIVDRCNEELEFPLFSLVTRSMSRE